MKQWHGHVTALTVQPTYRRLGLARKLMNLLEEVSEKKNTWFVGKLLSIFISLFILSHIIILDLFVRQTNTVAHELYKNLGYTTYRRVLNYYGASSKDGLEEDAYDMRKSMSKDVHKETTEPLKRPVRPDEIEWH